MLALAGALFNAGATVLIRYGLREASAATGAWINMAVGAAGMWAIVLATGAGEPVDATGLAFFALAGLIGTLAGRLLRFVAIDRVGASVAAAIMNLSPFLSAALAIVALGERVTLPVLAGTTVIVLGTVLLSASGRQVGFRPRHLVFPFLSATCFAVVMVLRKVALGHTGPMVGFAVNVTAGLVAYTAYLVASGRHEIMMCRGRSLVHFVAAGVTDNLGVFLALVALQWGTVSVVAPLTGVSPIFVLLLSVLFLRRIERLTTRVVAGTVLVVLGVYLVTRG